MSEFWLEVARRPGRGRTGLGEPGFLLCQFSTPARLSRLSGVPHSVAGVLAPEQEQQQGEAETADHHRRRHLPRPGAARPARTHAWSHSVDWCCHQAERKTVRPLHHTVPRQRQQEDLPGELGPPLHVPLQHQPH